MNYPSLFNKQSILLAIWFASLVLSIVLYSGPIASVFGKTNLCSYPDLGQAFFVIIQPKNWLGIFAIFLTSLGLISASRNAFSKWPLLDQYKWSTLFTGVFLAAVMFSFGCR